MKVIKGIPVLMFLFVFLPVAPAAAENKGLLPVPVYAGDPAGRDYLTGDWSGTRTELAEKGVQFNIDWTQSLQKVTNGGVDHESGYGGNLDYAAAFDLMKMGVLPGALINFKAETRYGESINGGAGSILPVNTDALFPLTRELDDEVGFTITNLSYTQFLSESLGVVIGKFDTLDGDPNEFASGRGTTQFMNANMLFNSVMALRLPYSTLGGGVIWMPAAPSEKGGITIKSMVFATSDSSEKTGFDTFDDGLTWSTEMDTQYRLGKLPGGQNIGFLYSFDQDFSKVGDRFTFRPGEGLVPQNESHTWAAFWSAWQYFVVHDPKNRAVDTADKKADHQGFGLFARAGIADQDTNPIKFSFSGGLGGRGVLGRVDDTYGLGYYYSRLQETRFSGLAGISNDAQGLETYYNLAITPAVQLTMDLQFIDSILPKTDPAFSAGGRLRFVF